MHMERSAVNKNRCIALKDWDRMHIHAKHRQTGSQGSLGIEWDQEPSSVIGIYYYREIVEVWYTYY